MMRNFFYAKDAKKHVTIDDFLRSNLDRKLTPQGLSRAYMSFLHKNYDIEKEKRDMMVYKDLEGMKFLTWHRMNNTMTPDIIYHFAIVMEYREGKLMCEEIIPCKYIIDDDVIEDITGKYPDIIVCQLE